MGKKKFVAAAFDLEYKTYIFHIGSVNSDALPNSFPLDVYIFWRPRTSGLIAEEAPTKVSAKYLDFADIFSPDLAFEFPKHTRINNHAIELVNN